MRPTRLRLLATSRALPRNVWALVEADRHGRFELGDEFIEGLVFGFEAFAAPEPPLVRCQMFRPLQHAITEDGV